MQSLASSPLDRAPPADLNGWALSRGSRQVAQPQNTCNGRGSPLFSWGPGVPNEGGATRVAPKSEEKPSGKFQLILTHFAPQPSDAGPQGETGQMAPNTRWNAGCWGGAGGSLYNGLRGRSEGELSAKSFFLFWRRHVEALSKETAASWNCLAQPQGVVNTLQCAPRKPRTCRARR